MKRDFNETVLYIAIIVIITLLITVLMEEPNEITVNTKTYNDSNVLKAVSDLSNQLTLKKMDCNQEYYVDTCAGSFESITKNVAKINDYKANLFDCDQFASEFVHQMKTAGFKQARTVSVSVDCRRQMWINTNCAQFSGRHTIARIDDLFIETTSGHIIMPKNYDDYNLTRSVY